MPRKKETLIEYGPASPPVAVASDEQPEMPSSFTEQYKAMVDRPNTRGRLSPYKATFVPPGIKLMLASNPVSEVDKVTYKELQMQGWVPLASNLATDDEWEAKEKSLVAFPYIDDRDGIVHIGPYIVMWKPQKAFMDSYLEDVRKLQSPGGARGVEITEDKAEDAQTAVHYREGAM